MKSPRLRCLLVAVAFVLPALAHAHPGHDGDHGLVWDYEHLARHPLATFACLFLLAAASWSIWRFAKMRPSDKAAKQPIRQ